MNSKITLFLLIGGLAFSSAQVGINSTAPQSTLDIVASSVAMPNNNDGILIPRMDRFPATNPTAAQNSMIIDLNNTFASNPPGFYYWHNASTTWIPFLSPNDNWTLRGNAGTTENTNFVGTTDGQGLTFRTNNTARFRIDNGDQVHALARGTQNRPFYSWDEDNDIGAWLVGPNTFALGASW